MAQFLLSCSSDMEEGGQNILPCPRLPHKSYITKPRVISPEQYTFLSYAIKNEWFDIFIFYSRLSVILGLIWYWLIEWALLLEAIYKIFIRTIPWTELVIGDLIEMCRIPFLLTLISWPRYSSFYNWALHTESEFTYRKLWPFFRYFPFKMPSRMRIKCMLVSAKINTVNMKFSWQTT